MKKRSAGKARKDPTGAASVRWDLSPLYGSIDDPLLAKDVSDYTAALSSFKSTYKGKLADLLPRAIRDLCLIEMRASKIVGFLGLKRAENVSDATVLKKSAAIDRNLAVAIGEHLSFFDIELVALSDEVLNEWYAKDDFVLKYKPWIEHERLFKPHKLSEEVESALMKRAPYGPGSWGDLWDEFTSDLRFSVGRDKYTLDKIIEQISLSKSVSRRRALLKIVNDGLAGPYEKFVANTLSIITGAGRVEKEERAYTHPMEAENKSNRVSDDVVEALHAAVIKKGGELARRYYRLKAKLLGLKKLRWSDRNAPMPFADTSVILFDEAFRIVHGAYRDFSPTLANIIETLAREKCIDAPALSGKQSGAFNYSFILPGEKPMSYTFLNYHGTGRDVMTLAHELGHAVHGMLAGKAQGPLMSGAPLSYAETASVFGELLTFKSLEKRFLEKGKVKDHLALLMSKIDDTVNTVVRQIGFSNFERRLHGMDSTYKLWHVPEKRSAEEVSSLWKETIVELYGKEGDVFVYDDMSRLWSYVHHFGRPFYVYSYAFGELLTHSLLAERERLGEKFEPLYLDLLRAGGTKGAKELLSPFGLDPSHPRFWEAGIEKSLGALLEKAEALARLYMKKRSR